MKMPSRTISVLAVLGLVIATVAAIPILAQCARPIAPLSVQAPAQGSVPTGSAMPLAQASYVGFNSMKSLADAADTIAKGKAIAQRPERLNISEGADREANPTYVDCIVVDFSVQKAIKGAIRKNDVIRIAYLAGENVPGLKTSASSIVFLTRTEAGPYMPLNPAQAVIRIESGKVRADTAGLLVGDGADEDDILSQLTK